MTGLGKVTEARLEADRTRAQLLESVRELETHAMAIKERLTPRRIIGGIVDGAKHKGADLAEDAVDAVRARPIAATGVVAAIALFLAREPLIDLAGKLVGGNQAKKQKKSEKEAKPARKRSTRTVQKKAEQKSTEKG